MTVDKTPVHGNAAKVPSLSRLHDIDETVAGSDEDIRGRMVKDKDGRDIGKIEHLLIDDAEQKVRFMEVGSGGFLGLGETKSFIPVEAITRITADDVYISPSREHVAGALATTRTSSRMIRATSSICTRTTDTKGMGPGPDTKGIGPRRVKWCNGCRRVHGHATSVSWRS